MSTRRPMLAAKAPEELDLPAYISAKLDGVRCLIVDGVALTRKFEVIPNAYVQRMLGHPLLEGLDGELCVGPAYGNDVFARTQSGVMSYAGEPDFMFHVFDYCNGAAATTPYSARLAALETALALPEYVLHPRLQLLEQTLVHDIETLAAMQEAHLELGYEGLIARNPAAGYKFGRSTSNPIGARRMGKADGALLEPWCMLKIKKFSDGEARVVGFKELMYNENEAEEDALGLTKRGSSAEGLVPAGVLGALVVEDCVTGVRFNIGSGFTAAQRADLWARRGNLLGHVVSYTHFEVGVKTAPRFPIFKGFRDLRDIGDPA